MPLFTANETAEYILDFTETKLLFLVKRSLEGVKTVLPRTACS